MVEELTREQRNLDIEDIWDGDGRKYRIRAVADYEVDAEGELTFFRDFLKVRPVTYR